MDQPKIDLRERTKNFALRVVRMFPTLPTHMRVTIGKQTEMEAFLTAFRQVTA